MTFATKRIYDDPAARDGYRILVDRLWPRGVSKERARLDEWCRDIAPDDELRKEFAHRAERWQAFKKAYFRQLDSSQDLVAAIRARARQGRVTLLYAARDEEHNNAVALKEYLEAHEQAASE